MTLKPTISPASWLETGIQLETVNGLRLFKFTEALQGRSDELLERSKTGAITTEEQVELDSISELAQIFTYANSALAADAAWFLSLIRWDCTHQPLIHDYQIKPYELPRRASTRN